MKEETRAQLYTAVDAFSNGFKALLITVVFGTAIVSPVFGLKLLYTYILGPTATLYSAFLSFPAVFITVGLAFATLYIISIDSGNGTLVKGNLALDTSIPRKDWSLVEVFYFSLSTLLKGAPQYEASGWCRWIALTEVLIGRLLELAIVTIGFANIIRHSIPAGSLR